MIRILIVTEHKEVGEDLCTMLGLDDTIEIVGVAPSTSSAEKQASANRPDIVLVDLEMAGSSGYETVRQMAGAGMTVIALTAYDYPEARKGALQAGANRVMIKGMDLQEMVDIFRMVVDYSN
jgi:DNA-binding NarL/FixJ family response regulator